MKKFVVLLVVVAMTLVSGVAFAEVTVGGVLQLRSRNFDNLDFTDTARSADTQTRFKLDVNAKVGDVRGKLQLWNDFESWDGLETQGGSVVTNVTGTDALQYDKNTIGIREAWISFDLPGLPVTVTGGHQLLALGNSWFFRSMHFGSDAWVLSTKVGDNTFGLVDVKISEGVVASGDDIDAYVVFGAFKLNDDMALGFDVTDVKDRRGDLGTGTTGATGADLYNVSAHFNGKVGPVALKAQVDFQAGSVESATGDVDFSGNQVVVQGSVPIAPVTLNFTVARGSGDDAATGDEIEGMVTALDVDPHYTFLWEYKTAGAGAAHQGFSNVTALNVGASFAVSKNLTVGADLWQLAKTETAAGVDDEIGTEVDVKVNWKVADNLAWNWVLGMLKPGDALGTEDATGIQGVLTYKF